MNIRINIISFGYNTFNPRRTPWGYRTHRSLVRLGEPSEQASPKTQTKIYHVCGLALRVVSRIHLYLCTVRSSNRFFFFSFFFWLVLDEGDFRCKQRQGGPYIHYSYDLSNQAHATGTILRLLLKTYILFFYWQLHEKFWVEPRMCIPFSPTYQMYRCFRFYFVYNKTLKSVGLGLHVYLDCVDFQELFPTPTAWSCAVQGEKHMVNMTLKFLTGNSSDMGHYRR